MLVKGGGQTFRTNIVLMGVGGQSCGVQRIMNVKVTFKIKILKGENTTTHNFILAITCKDVNNDLIISFPSILYYVPKQES